MEESTHINLDRSSNDHSKAIISNSLKKKSIPTNWGIPCRREAKNNEIINPGHTAS